MEKENTNTYFAEEKKRGGKKRKIYFFAETKEEQENIWRTIIYIFAKEKEK